MAEYQKNLRQHVIHAPCQHATTDFLAIRLHRQARMTRCRLPCPRRLCRYPAAVTVRVQLTCHQCHVPLDHHPVRNGGILYDDHNAVLDDEA